MVNEKVKEVFKDEPLFTKLTDLAAEKLGGKTLYCTDDFFAEKENLIKPGRGVFIAEKFTSTRALNLHGFPFVQRMQSNPKNLKEKIWRNGINGRMKK